MHQREENDSGFKLYNIVTSLAGTELMDLHGSSMYLTHTENSWTARCKLPIWITVRDEREGFICLKIFNNPDNARSLSATSELYNPETYDFGSPHVTIGFASSLTGKQETVSCVFESEANLDDGSPTYVNSIILLLESGFTLSVSDNDTPEYVKIHYRDCDFRVAFGYDEFSLY